MGRLKKIVYICLVMVLCFTAAAPSVHAVDKIDVDREASLTIQYSHSGRACKDVQVKTYRVANVDAAGEFTLCKAFAGYDVDVNNVSSQDEWKTISETLAAYAAADKIKAYRTAKTNNSGIVRFSGIDLGLYLTVSSESVLGQERIIFENFMTVVPHYDHNGNYSYNVIAYPKADAYVPQPGKVEYKVVKHWKDSGHKESRPDSIRVEIIKNGVHESYQTLNADNNWTYSWKAADDGSKWQVVERDKPEGYKAKIQKKGRTVIITNTLIPTEEGSKKPPQTGDTTSMWPFVGVMGFAGAVMLLFAIWRKREE